jgi:predicted CoA-binding protein
MPSNHETFWQHTTYAVVGDKKKQNFPELTYRGLKKLGKRVFPVDPQVPHFDGDKAYPDLAALPERVDAVVLEVPKEDTRDWVARAAEAGVEDVWIHMGRDTPEALDLAQENGINARHGTCAVMYVTPGFTYHAIHRLIMKVVGKY